MARIKRLENAGAGMIHMDGCREPARVQAVILPWPMVLLRKLCYLLAQKGDPTL